MLANYDILTKQAAIAKRRGELDYFAELMRLRDVSPILPRRKPGRPKKH